MRLDSSRGNFNGTLRYFGGLNIPRIFTNAKEVLKGKYIGDEKQYQVNFDAYRAKYDNIGLTKIIVDKLFGLFWSMSSLGNFIGATFDLCDGKYDGYFRIYVRG